MVKKKTNDLMVKKKTNDWMVRKQPAHIGICTWLHTPSLDIADYKKRMLGLIGDGDGDGDPAPAFYRRTPSNQNVTRSTFYLKSDKRWVWI